MDNVTDTDGDHPAQPAESAESVPPLPDRRTALGIMGGFGIAAAVGTIFGGDLLHPPATTTDGDYAGETLRFVIPLAEGGGTDTWARFVGTELTQVIPGKPGFAPENEAGGEGHHWHQPLCHLSSRRRH